MLLDPYPLLGMCALLPLLEAVDTLVNFAQKRDIYICNFMVAMKICQASLYKMYEDKATLFSTDEFWSFNNLLDASHEQIHIKWIIDLNDHFAVLCFVCHGEQIHAEHKGDPVNRELWATLVAKVKSKCTSECFLNREVLVNVLTFLEYSYRTSKILCCMDGPLLCFAGSCISIPSSS